MLSNNPNADELNRFTSNGLTVTPHPYRHSHLRKGARR